MNFLPGWFPGGAFGAKVLTALTQVASATSGLDTITGPAGIQAGDLLVLYDVAYDSGLPATAVPTDFTVINNTVGLAGDTRLISSCKIADGSEASATLTGMDGSISVNKMLYVFRGDVPIAVVSVEDIAQQSTGSNPTAQTVNASGGAVPLVVLGCYSTYNTALSPRTMSPAKDGEIQSDEGGIEFFDNWLAYKIYNSSPADVSVDMDDESSENYLSSFFIECS